MNFNNDIQARNYINEWARQHFHVQELIPNEVEDENDRNRRADDQRHMEDLMERIYFRNAQEHMNRRHSINEPIDISRLA